jgi:MFS transporter, DHA2 family, multidrug resistance protein
MLLVGRLIDRIDLRILLATGWVLMAAGLTILSDLRPDDAISWILIGSTIQAVGAGMLYAPLSMLAFSTLSPELRTDATGVFSLLRQIGYASGVALMTAILRVRIANDLASLLAQGAGPSEPVPAAVYNLATLQAYAECFRMMAVAALLVIPGIFLFRIGRINAPVEEPS